MRESDESLVLASQRGDRAAFEELVRRTARLVYARAYLDAADAHRAEDLAQEAYLVAWKKIAQVAEPGGFRKWLLSIVQTVAIDAARRDSRKKRSGNRVDAEVLAGVPARGAGPHQAAETAEDCGRALEVLRSLPEEYRLPLMLRYIVGADYEAIGLELGVSNGSLRGLLHRGLEMMRERMRTA